MTPDELIAKTKSEPARVEKMLISFISSENLRAEKGKITAGTVGNAIKAVKLLLEMNDAPLNWKKIKRVLPKARRYALDRVPTVDEIQSIMEAADVRGKPLTLVFISGGIREGAVAGLKVSDFTRVEDGLGRLVVYNGDPEGYVTFISPEASDALEKYLDFRRQHGEIVSADSPLFRDKFDPLKQAESGRGHHGHTRRNAKDIIIPMTGPSVRQYYNRLLKSIGIRKQAKKRH